MVRLVATLFAQLEFAINQRALETIGRQNKNFVAWQRAKIEQKSFNGSHELSDETRNSFFGSFMHCVCKFLRNFQIKISASAILNFDLVGILLNNVKS